MDYDGIRDCTTPQTFQNPHTSSISADLQFNSTAIPEVNSGRNWRSRSLGFELKPFGLTIEVPANFNIPGNTFPFRSF